ncbi:MAG TPA: M64 family metallopeptidase [Chitinophaga sp.]|uniref:M64 family metallopeptidase n=1 Tax=Chitinophaga sp. TaxID=1869181 RepID=UPI002F93BBDB
MKKILFSIFICCTISAAIKAQTVTEVLRNGSNGAKLNLVIIGDGFTAADQAAYNTHVTNLVKNLFSKDLYDETMDAYNIYRINVNSTQSGVTKVNASGTVTTARNTALDYRYSGIWDRCWMEPGPNTATRLNNLLTTLVPQYNYVFIILNETGFGGCAGGGKLAITRGADDNDPGWSTAAHEMGHMVGLLADEYTVNCDNYTSEEPAQVNVTKNTNRATLKGEWKNFVPASRPVPTISGCSAANPSGNDTDEDAGVFEGAQYTGLGKFRPAYNCRMKGNSPLFCPVCYNQMQARVKPYRSYNFNNSYAGDFTGDGKGDLVVHYGNSISMYSSDGSKMNHVFTGTERVNTGGSSWQFKPGDKFYVADFDGDGKKDLYVFNSGDWGSYGPYFALLRSTGTGFDCVKRYDKTLEGWQMSAGDDFYVGDFDGDGKEDFYIVNTTTWSTKYVGMMKAASNKMSFIKRYDNNLGAPGYWIMAKNDEFYVGDFDGDKKADLYMANLKDWTTNYVGMLKSTGATLNCIRVFNNTLPGWTMADNDQHLVGDFDGDGKADMYVFNGTNWNPEYLLMLKSTGSNLSYVKRFDGVIPGWEMAPNDRLYVADANGDGKKDLYIYNTSNWDKEYLGILTSNGTTLSGTWQKDWIGSWNLGSVDKLAVTNFNGGAGWDDLFIYNTSWFGMLRSNTTSLSQVYISPNYIHNFKYHKLGWW